MAQRRYSSATRDARGNYWAQAAGDDGTSRRVAVRQLADENGAPYYTAYDNDAISAANTSGGGLYQSSQLGEDAWRWQPGAVVSQAELQGLLQKLNDPRWTQGATGNLTAEQYLADPRSVLKVENGRLVYRPDLAQGKDWEPVDYRAHGFKDQMKEVLSYPGVQLMLAAFGGYMLGPAMGAAGAAGGEAAGSAFPTFLGEAAGSGLGATGAAAGSVVPDSYWNMVAQNGGTMTDVAPGLGDLGDLGGLGDYTSSVFGPEIAFGPTEAGSIEALSQTPAIGSYGALDTGLGAVAGGEAGSIPAIQGVMQSGPPSMVDGILNGLREVYEIAKPVAGIVNAVSPIIGGATGVYAARKAADAQVAAAKDANRLQTEMYQQNRADLQPWRDAGTRALAQINAGLEPGGQFARRFTMADFEKDPGYQFRMDEGVRALDRSASARGRLFSGAQGRAVTRYGQDYASNEFSNAYNRFRLDNSDIFNRYASTAGIGQTATNQLVQQGSNLANNVGNNTMGAGNARASGYVGGANALTNSLSQGMQAYQNQQILGWLQNQSNPYPQYRIEP